MFEAYAQRIEAEVPVHQDLPYDAVREKLRTKYGILTSPRSTNAIQEISDPFLLSFTKGKTKFKEYSLKIGLAESQFLLDQLDKLPRKLVPGIKRIKRYFDPISDFDLFLNGANTLGTFNGETLTLYSPKNMPFKAFDNTQSQIFCDVLQHELGHGIWNSLDEKLQSEWRSLTRAKNNLSSKNHIININNLRDIYSGRDINSPENKPKLGISIDQFKIEEFCWTFSAYVNHGEEFRTMSKASEVLQKKYDLIKRIINQYTTQEESLEYSTTPLATLKQLDMFRRNIIDSYSRNEAYMLAKKEHEQKEKESMEAREEVVESFEQRYENHGASIDAYTQYENSIDRPYDDDRYSLYVQLHTLMPSGIDYKPISPMESDHIFDILIDSVEETAKYMMQRFFFLDDRDDLIDHFESTRYWLIERATKREV